MEVINQSRLSDDMSPESTSQKSNYDQSFTKETQKVQALQELISCSEFKSQKQNQVMTPSPNNNLNRSQIMIIDDQLDSVIEETFVVKSIISSH